MRKASPAPGRISASLRATGLATSLARLPTRALPATPEVPTRVGVAPMPRRFAAPVRHWQLWTEVIVLAQVDRKGGVGDTMYLCEEHATRAAIDLGEERIPQAEAEIVL